MELGKILISAASLALCVAQGAEAMDDPNIAGAAIQRERRYKVEIIHFKAENETGADKPGSDRVFGVFDTAGYRLITRRHENVDAGEKVDFAADNRCVSPAVDGGGFDHSWQCQPDGIAAPIDFTVALYDYKGPGVLKRGCARRHRSDVLRTGRNDCTVKAAELIGSARIAFSAEQLEHEIAREFVAINGESAIFTCPDLPIGEPCLGSPSDTSPYYRIHYRITRIGDSFSGIAGPEQPPVP